MSDLFILVETEVCNYVDDTTIYVCGNAEEHIVSSLETDAQKLDNNMELNPDKCHLLIFGEKNTDASVQKGATLIAESVEETLLVVMLDKHLDFKNHVISLGNKPQQELHGIARIHVFQTIWRLRD